jgi:hypothetical protein
LVISKPAWYSRQGLWSLFLVCAFPLHVWTILLAFRDFSWVAERTQPWDAIGVLAYALVFAFVESLVVFLVAVLLGFLLPRRWEPGKRIALLSILVLVTSVWAMLGQLFFLWNLSLPSAAIQLLAQNAHPLRVLYAGFLVLVVPTVLVPIYLVLRSEGTTRVILNLVDRLSTLSSIYLFLDAASLVVVVIRNL